MRVLKENCTLEDGQDTTLPYTCYIVTYKVDGNEKYDLAMGSKQSEIFDYYYDLYKKDFVTFKQSAGKINPTLWNNTTSSKKSYKKNK